MIFFLENKGLPCIGAYTFSQISTILTKTAGNNIVT
jgi:hypothetical protein